MVKLVKRITNELLRYARISGKTVTTTISGFSVLTPIVFRCVCLDIGPNDAVGILLIGVVRGNPDERYNL